MLQYKQDFIEFLVRSNVLTFGDFTTKSGRKTPYFINTGNYRTGTQLARLGEFYAQALIANLTDPFDNLYGPAYKGIPLAVTSAGALSRCHGLDVSVTYNRKEAKDPGEKGILIVHPYKGSERIVIIEDVITAGTSVRETLDILKHNNNPHVAAVIVSVDRMERGQSSLSAIEEIQKELKIQVFSIVTGKDIFPPLHNRPVDGKILLDDSLKQRMLEYLQQYGV